VTNSTDTSKQKFFKAGKLAVPYQTKLMHLDQMSLVELEAAVMCATTTDLEREQILDEMLRR
jgi:hypothetical protein